MQYANQRAKEAAIAIANDPSKAYDYGKDNNWKLDSKAKNNFMNIYSNEKQKT